jgi:hypothetical protein
MKKYPFQKALILKQYPHWANKRMGVKTNIKQKEKLKNLRTA